MDPLASGLTAGLSALLTPEQAVVTWRNFDTYDEPELTVHSPQVSEWMQAAVLALHERDVPRAEPLLRKVLAQESDKPDLLNNSAMVGCWATVVEIIGHQLFDKP